MDEDKAKWQREIGEAARRLRGINESFGKVMERFQSVDGALNRRSAAIEGLRKRCDQQEAKIVALEKEVAKLKELEQVVPVLQTQVGFCRSSSTDSSPPPYRSLPWQR